MAASRLCLVLAAALPACGGSSSETPFPLEPDLRRETRAQSSEREVVFSGRGAADAATDESEDLFDESSPARPTWGGSRE
jgi:hypothetical protein